MITLNKRTIQLFADVDGDGDTDSTDQMLTSMGGGGAAPSSGALTRAPRAWAGNIYRNPGGPVTTTQAGSANIAGPMTMSPYAKVAPGGGGQMQFPSSYDAASAGMDYYGNAVNLISPFQQAFNRVSMNPMITGIGNSIGLAGLLGLSTLRGSQAPDYFGAMSGQRAAGRQQSFSAPTGNPVTSTGVVQAPNANLSAGYNPTGSMTPGNQRVAMPGQPQFNPSPLGQFGLDMYNRASAAGSMIQRAPATPLTTPTTFTNPQELSRQSLSGNNFRNRNRNQ